MKIFILALITSILASQSTIQTMAPTPSSLGEEVTFLAAKASGLMVDLDKLQSMLENYLEENTYEDEYWQAAVIIPQTSQEILVGYNEDQTAASTVKLFICGAIMEAFDGLVPPEGSDDYFYDLLDSLVYSTLTISDNEAATELIAILGDGDTDLGKKAVNDYCKEWGFDQTYIGIIFSGTDPTGTYNSTSARDSARFMEMILNDELPGSSTILSYLKESERTNKIPSAIPDGIVTANKTGELLQTENDTCIVFGKEYTYILSILATDVEVSSAQYRIQEISSMVYEFIEEPND